MPGIASGVSSMTGFASAQGRTEAASWAWQVRSVNGRGLDVKLRVPQGWDKIEASARRLLSERFSRGNISASLQIERQGGAVGVALNTAQLRYFVDVIADLRRKYDFAAPSVDGILALKGVIEPVEDANLVAPDTEAAVLEGFAGLVESLALMRAAEGDRIRQVVSEQLDSIAEIVAAIRSEASRAPEVIRSRLMSQVEDLVEAAPALAPDRLHQEVALLSAKADVREELDRLDAHVAAARDLLEQGGAVGRRLDFLSQEFNREANTICSKSIHYDITSAGLELKAVIDQMREQVQNVE